MEALLNGGGKVDQTTYDGISPLYLAAQNGSGEIVAILIRAKANLNLLHESGESALYKAAQQGHHDIIKQLIDAHVDLDNGLSAVFVACMSGHARIVEALFNAGAGIDPPTLRCIRATMSQVDISGQHIEEL